METIKSTKITRQRDPERNNKLLCIFAPSYDEGGVERMLANLAAGLCSQNVAFHFVTDNPESPYLRSLQSQGIIRGIEDIQRKNLTSVFAHYLAEQKPTWILVSKEGAAKIAIAAKQKVPCHSQLAFCVSTTHSAMTRRYIFPKRLIKLQRIRRLCRKADLIIAVSRGVAEDVSKIAELPLHRIIVAPNPVVAESMTLQANETITHEWFSNSKKKCIILGVGRFSRAKDFPTLVHAFAKVKKKIPNSELLILGDGRQRSMIVETARRLDVAQDVLLPGFDPNPYPYFAKADIFVLSSKWEGLPSALIEALALGTPVVSTDCPSGPREILQNGRYGLLVPPGDPSALAEAILITLAKPLPVPVLKEAALPYTIRNSTLKYLEAMGWN